MHSSSCDLDVPRLGGAEVLVAIAALVTEGRTPNTHTSHTNARGGFTEGPHCTASKASQGHLCNDENQLCMKYDRMQTYVVSLWQKSLPLCIDVLLVPKCCCENDLICNPSTSLEQIGAALLLEQWHVTILHRRTHDYPSNFTTNQLINAIRSQLYFSQISAWLAAPDDKIRTTFIEQCIVVYCLTVPGESYGSVKFTSSSHQHTFPTADIGNGVTLKVSLANLARSDGLPELKCSKCDVPMAVGESNIAVLDDRMQTSCTLKGKHRCEDYDELESCCTPRFKKRDKNYLECPTGEDASTPSTSRNLFANLSNQTPSAKAKLQLNFSAAPAENGDKSKLQLNFAPEMDGPDQSLKKKHCDGNKVDLELSKKEFVEVLNVLRHSGPIKQTKKTDLSKGDILLGAILRSSTRVQQLEKTALLDGHEELVMQSQEESSKSLDFLAKESNSTRATDEDVFYKNKQFLDSSAANNKRKSGLPTRPPGPGQMRIRNCDKKMCDTGRTDTIIKLLQRTVSSSSLNNNSNSNNSVNSGRFNFNDIYTDTTHCDSVVKRKKTQETNRICDVSNVFSREYLEERRQKVKVKQKISFEQQPAAATAEEVKPTAAAAVVQEEGEEEEEEVKHSNGIPSALEQAKFRKSLDSAASMVFHSRTGLPLTSSPAPVRRGKSCFDFDSSINSVSAIRSALFSLASCSTDEDSESDCSIVSPCSPDAVNGLQQREVPPVKYRHRGQSSGLLGSFVESVLNGRLEPVSTVHGFSAELGASGSFCPRHVVLPVTVFFYTLGDNDKVSTPYLGHINLGKKGYNVPKSGTIQVTLFNPLGTVVKMFVIMYDLSDMPANSQTFIRQRTLFMPANCEGRNLEWSQRWLRYLIHLRFMSSKSGRIYLHSDIRMIICRKSDLDTATAHGLDMSYELRSFTHSPTNPKFSPRK